MHDAGRASEPKLAASEGTADRQRLPAERTVRHDRAVARRAISWDGTCIRALIVLMPAMGQQLCFRVSLQIEIEIEKTRGRFMQRSFTSFSEIWTMVVHKRYAYQRFSGSRWMISPGSDIIAEVRLPISSFI